MNGDRKSWISVRTEVILTEAVQFLYENARHIELPMRSINFFY
jgi:hypothetical protein